MAEGFIGALEAAKVLGVSRRRVLQMVEEGLLSQVGRIGGAILLRRADEISISQAAPFAPIRVARVEQETAAANERTLAWNARSA